MCQVSVGVLGDVCRAIEARIAPFCDKIMSVLLTNLQSNDVQRNIKPQILSAFGDIAIAIGDAFEAYLPHVLQMLQSAQARPLSHTRGWQGRWACLLSLRGCRRVTGTLKMLSLDTSRDFGLLVGLNQGCR